MSRLTSHADPRPLQRESLLGTDPNLNRSTECVFHLMRVMETAVQVLGNRLGVQLTADKNWQNILDEANKAIKGMN